MLWTSLKAVMGVLFMMGEQVPYEIKSFSFTDSSSYVCANEIGSVSLPILSLLTSGMTWYEKHFGAYPDTVLPNENGNATSQSSPEARQ
jgi:hypothetical protein